MTISLILLVVAFILLLCQTFGVPSRISLGWLGLAIWCLSLLVGSGLFVR